jgi:voltage-gated potassium channel
MIRREVQRRFHNLVQETNRRFERLRESSAQPREFLMVLLEGVQIQLVGIGLGLTTLLGTIVYMIIERWNAVDAFYMTVITLSTVGFGEVLPLSPVGRVFTVMLILVGIGLFTYGVSSAIEYIATGEVLVNLAARRKEERLFTMKNYFIIVGFGRVGREVAAALYAEQSPFVVIDVREESIEDATERGYICVTGSATEDNVLLEAGIQQARGLVACAGSDATNVYAVLTARGLNDKLLIIARTIDDHSEPKMLRAGANRVISPYSISGRRMANLALRPHVVDFLDITATSTEIEQALEEVIVEDGAIIANQTIGQVDLRRRTGANILALYLPNGKWVSNPTTATILEPGTRLILLGNRDQLDVTEALARSLPDLANTDGDSNA